jgi:hypothetical protein
VVLGLSVTLAKQQGTGQPPSETSFGSFVGVFSIIVSIIGLVSLWVDKLSGLGIMVIDLITAVFNLAGAIVSQPATFPSNTQTAQYWRETRNC